LLGTNLCEVIINIYHFVYDLLTCAVTYDVAIHARSQKCAAPHTGNSNAGHVILSANRSRVTH